MTRLLLRHAACVAVLLLPTQACSMYRFSAPVVGVNADYSHFPKFEREVGRVPGVQSYSSPSGIAGTGIWAEWERPERDYFLGTSVRYGAHEFEQRFNPALDGPIVTQGRVNGWFFDAYGGRRWPVGRQLSFDLRGGPALAYNDAQFDQEYADGVRGLRRSHTALKFRVGTAFNYQLGSRFGVRAGVDYLGLLNSDADDHTRFSIGLSHRFGGFNFSRSPLPSRREARHAR